MSTQQASHSEIFYIINKDNIIIEVGGKWNEAAKEGKAENLLKLNNVIGQPIENFVCSDTTQMYYDAVFKLCRLKKETMSREYRCDSPILQRFMRVTLTPLENGAIKLFHETLKEQPFNNPITTVDSGYSRKTSLNNIKRCSVCNRLSYPDKKNWVEPGQVSEKMSIRLNVIHTICPDCKSKNWMAVSKHKMNNSLNT